MNDWNDDETVTIGELLIMAVVSLTFLGLVGGVIWFLGRMHL